MKPVRSQTFDELMSSYYGRPPVDATIAVRSATLLSSFYGQPTAFHGRRFRHRAHGLEDVVDVPDLTDPGRGGGPTATTAPSGQVVSLSQDDGEVMDRRTNAPRHEEYVTDDAPATGRSEVDPAAPPRTALARAAEGPWSDMRAECTIDLLGAPQNRLAPPMGAPAAEATAPSATASPAMVLSPSASASPAVDAPSRAHSLSDVDTTTQAPAPPAVPAPPPATPDDAILSTAKVDDDAFMQDMQAILSGQMVYDPRNKVTVPPSQLGAPEAGERRAPAGAEPRKSDAGGHEIFERIAQSMAYANAYDIGSFDLDNRFAELDRADRQQQRDAERRTMRSGADAGSPAAAAGLLPPAPAPAPAMAAPPAASTAADPMSNATSRDALSAGLALVAPSGPGYSTPFYDTGEHVLFGGQEYVDRLRVGPAPGVPFSYGQIIAMGDFFADIDQMMATGVADLKGLKTLIESSTAFYAGGKIDKSKDVSDDKWTRLLGKKYLALAEVNFAHFSPNVLFKGQPYAKAASAHTNNKAAWETYHRRAIREAQAIGLQSKGSTFLEGPLITNAFGDHFLTDAFSAGHLVNKDVVIAFWKSLFFKSGSNALNDDARNFFHRLADRAWELGLVKSTFVKLETVETKFWFWHPDIKNADRFALVLIGVAEAEPDRIGNMVIKAIHDELNTKGVDVTNQAGDGTWHLTGDGTLDMKNRGIIHKAVMQSIDNINDPSILASNLNVDLYFDKVWKHVPVMPPTSRQFVESVVRRYVGPTSADLVEAAAQIISAKLDLLVAALKDAKALQDID